MTSSEKKKLLIYIAIVIATLVPASLVSFVSNWLSENEIVELPMWVQVGMFLILFGLYGEFSVRPSIKLLKQLKIHNKWKNMKKPIKFNHRK